MANVTITRGKPPRPASVGPDGPFYSASWTVEAQTQSDVFALMRSMEGVFYGSTYEEEDGGTPDENVKCIGLEIDTRFMGGFTTNPNGPTTSGTGYFIVNGYFGYPRVGSLVPNIGATRLRTRRLEESKPVDRTWDGVAIVNAADEPFDQPPVKLTTEEILEVTWQVVVSDYIQLQSTFRAYYDKVNSVVIYGAPPKCLRFIKPDINDVQVNPLAPNTGVFEIVLPLHFKPQFTIDDVTYGGWEEVRINRGRRFKLSVGDDEYQRITMPRDNDPTVRIPIDEPVLLNAAGTDWFEGGTPNYRRFDIYEPADYRGVLPP